MDIHDKLFNKMQSEQIAFVEKTLTLPPAEILRKGYEFFFREDILQIVENCELSDNHAKQLFKLEKPLADLYDIWLDSDASYMDMLRDVIDDYGILLCEQAKAAKPPKSFER